MKTVFITSWFYLRHYLIIFSRKKSGLHYIVLHFHVFRYFCSEICSLEGNIRGDSTGIRLQHSRWGGKESAVKITSSYSIFLTRLCPATTKTSSALQFSLSLLTKRLNVMNKERHFSKHDWRAQADLAVCQIHFVPCNSEVVRAVWWRINSQHEKFSQAQNCQLQTFGNHSSGLKRVTLGFKKYETHLEQYILYFCIYTLD